LRQLSPYALYSFQFSTPCNTSWSIKDLCSCIKSTFNIRLEIKRQTRKFERPGLWLRQIVIL
jgi:hypothetical protein